ncbi:MAG: ABC transporter ATP-binding protein [Spirochaetaceae bacterium]|jgi:oligopeptide/dipeptide ABC transporter ATP-binding protein|nr:ABC transporter ATP-binding protein [Spirochaetaceae bacterium]
MRNAPPAVLDVQHLSISCFSRVTGYKRDVVRDVGFSVASGAITGIVGESGSGKTLTAQAVAGLLPGGTAQTGGSIRFAGADMGRFSRKTWRSIRGNELTMVFQEHRAALNPLIPVIRQIAEPLALHGVDRKTREKRAREVMAQVGLPPEIERAYPHEISGGMCQRVMIAQAAVSRPKLLIADEPTTALDLSTQGRILRLLKTIHRETGAAILCISHDVEVIRSLCRRVLVMYAGKLVETGSVEAVLSGPRHPYTKGLLESLPHKALKGALLPVIPGRAPDLSDEKTEETPCPFAPRCAAAQAPCLSEPPLPTRVGEDHQVSCHACT